MQSFRNEKKFFYGLLGLMLVLHGLFLLSKIRTSFSEPTFSQVSTPAPIQLKILQETMKDLAMSNHKKQIVQSEDPADKTKPKDKAFLSDKDRNFDRQTMARNVDTFKNTAKGNANVTSKAEKPSVAQAPSTPKKEIKLSDLGMPAEVQKMPAPSRSPASESMKGIKNGDPLSNGFSATNDYVEEVALGDFTHLNTVEFKFYGFYHRIRQKLEQFWGKSIQEKAHGLFRAGRRLPANEDLITSLKITMNEKGEIVDVKVLGASGVKELDDAAIESFNQAGPFPNPPKELLVKGKATIEWGFVVKS
jgi:TonB family protein